MLQIIKTDTSNADFLILVQALDKELAIRDGDDHPFYARYNTLDTIKHVVVAYTSGTPSGCGAIKKYDAQTMEVKRMFVPEIFRGKGIALKVLQALEAWAIALGYKKCILETGIRQPEAIALYKKAGYRIIENYGQYSGKTESVCFEKMLMG
jgi:putative acetyltransferase